MLLGSISWKICEGKWVENILSSGRDGGRYLEQCATY